MNSRRLRVHQGVASGAVLPGRALDDYWRGHQRDSAFGDRPPATAEAGVPSVTIASDSLSHLGISDMITASTIKKLSQNVVRQAHHERREPLVRSS